MLNCYQNTTSYPNIIPRILHCIWWSKNTVAFCDITVTISLEERFELPKLIQNFTKYAHVQRTRCAHARAPAPKHTHARTHSLTHSLTLITYVCIIKFYYLYILNVKIPRATAYHTISTCNKYLYLCAFLESVTFRHESPLITQYIFPIRNPQCRNENL
jgi:hypothetical protein